MPSFDFSRATAARLESKALALDDTIEGVVNQALDALDHGQDVPSQTETPRGIREFDPFSAPDLTHTKVLSAEFCGRRLSKSQAKWNGLLNEAVRLAKATAGNEDEFHRLVIVNCVAGRKDDEGFRFLPDANVSVQGQDAMGAWKAVYHIARHLGCSLDIVFMWRAKADAAYPGVTGHFKL